MRPCRAAHCGAPTSSRFSPHCRRHKSRLRRQGDVEQTAIRRSELAPYVSLVRERIAKNAHSPLWGHLDARWAALASSAKDTAGNRVQSRYQRQAAHELLNLEAECSARDIAVTTMAMFLFWSERPERFLYVPSDLQDPTNSMLALDISYGIKPGGDGYTSYFGFTANPVVPGSKANVEGIRLRPRFTAGSDILDAAFRDQVTKDYVTLGKSGGFQFWVAGSAQWNVQPAFYDFVDKDNKVLSSFSVPLFTPAAKQK